MLLMRLTFDMSYHALITQRLSSRSLLNEAGWYHTAQPDLTTLQHLIEPDVFVAVHIVQQTLRFCPSSMSFLSRGLEAERQFSNA
jgi:hypothetical protein